MDIGGIILFIAVLVVSATLHEMMHGLVAYRLGDDLAHSEGRISFNPLVHIDPFLTIALPAIFLLLGQAPILAAKPVPINTSRIDGEEVGLAAVGLAGPLTNLAIAAVTGMLLRLIDPGGGLLNDVLLTFVVVNTSLFVFNMLPIPPLDGSRLLYAVAPRPLQQIMAQIESFGIFGVILILSFALPVISPILIAANEFFLRLFVG